VRPHDLEVERAGRAQGMAARLVSVMTTGPTFRLQLKLERADADVEAEMAKSRFEVLGLAPGALVTLRPREFGVFPAPLADVSAAAHNQETATRELHAAVA
jgi:ABC-type sulfate/molybdate transport systems ATPase subunit